MSPFYELYELQFQFCNTNIYFLENQDEKVYFYHFAKTKI